MGWRTSCSISGLTSGRTVWFTVACTVSTSGDSWNATNVWGTVNYTDGSQNINFGPVYKNSSVTRTISFSRNYDSNGNAFTVTANWQLHAGATSGNGMWSNTASYDARYIGPVPPSVVAPGTPTGVTLRRNSDTSLTLTWTNHPNVGGINNHRIEISINGGPWGLVTDTISGSATSYTYTRAEANSKYHFRIQSGNSAGASDWGTSNVIYTTPAAPASIDHWIVTSTGQQSWFSANLQNTRYPGSCVWQYNPGGSETWMTDTSIRSFDGSRANMNTKTLVRCAVKTPDGTLTSAFTAAKLPTVLQQCFINVPTGSTAKAVYINKP